MTLPSSVGQIQFYFFVQLNSDDYGELDNRQLDLDLEKLPYSAYFRDGFNSTDYTYNPPRYERLVSIFVSPDTRDMHLYSVEAQLIRILLAQKWQIRVPSTRDILG